MGEVTRRRVFRAPVLASWTHDSNTPYAMADISSTKVKVFNMRRFREQYEMQSRATPMTTPQRNILQESPMISNSGNIMMSAMMSDPFDDNVSGQAIGGPEAFYPWTYIDANGTIENQDSSSVAGSDCDDEDLWNIDDLLNFGNQDSDDEEEADPSDETQTGAEDTPGAPSSTQLAQQRLEAKTKSILSSTTSAAERLVPSASIRTATSFSTAPPSPASLLS